MRAAGVYSGGVFRGVRQLAIGGGFCRLNKQKDTLTVGHSLVLGCRPPVQIGGTSRLMLSHVLSASFPQCHIMQET